jgi:hypothetical protein
MKNATLPTPMTHIFSTAPTPSVPPLKARSRRYYHDNKNLYPSAAAYYLQQIADLPPAAHFSNFQSACFVKTCICFLRFGQGTSLVGLGGRGR